MIDAEVDEMAAHDEAEEAARRNIQSGRAPARVQCLAKEVKWWDGEIQGWEERLRELDSKGDPLGEIPGVMERIEEYKEKRLRLTKEFNSTRSRMEG